MNNTGALRSSLHHKPSASPCSLPLSSGAQCFTNIADVSRVYVCIRIRSVTLSLFLTAVTIASILSPVL